MIEALRNAKDEILVKNPKNKFLNDFIPSAISQFDDKGYLSNRQIEVVENVLSKNEFDVEAIKEAAAREVEIAFVELQEKYASVIGGLYLKKATADYEAYCNQCREMAARRKSRHFSALIAVSREMAARRKSRRTVGGYQYRV